MKKAQILSALALAFALGVAVIPTGEASAKFVKVDPKDGVSHIIDQDATDRVNTAIQNAKDSCGWHMVGTTQTWYYAQYNNLVTTLDNAQDAIKSAQDTQFTNLKNDYASTINSVKGAINSAITNGNLPAGTTVPAGVKDTFGDNITTYDQAVTFIREAASKFTSASTTSSAARNIYDLAVAGGDLLGDGAFLVNGLNNLITTANDAIDAVKDTQAINILSAVNQITGETTSTATYDAIVNRANSLSSDSNGVCSVAKVRNLNEAIEYATNMRDSASEIWSTYADKAIAAIQKAQNGGTITDGDTQKPDDNNGGNKAPDTGVLAGEEGSASTTVAMVAGVATALTAAGAGVVAYRNARRSTRK